jgi:hypothetical protein
LYALLSQFSLNTLAHLPRYQRLAAVLQKASYDFLWKSEPPLGQRKREMNATAGIIHAADNRC